MAAQNFGWLFIYEPIWLKLEQYFISSTCRGDNVDIKYTTTTTTTTCKINCLKKIQNCAQDGTYDGGSKL